MTLPIMITICNIYIALYIWKNSKRILSEISSVTTTEGVKCKISSLFICTETTFTKLILHRKFSTNLREINEANSNSLHLISVLSQCEKALIKSKEKIKKKSSSWEAIHTLIYTYTHIYIHILLLILKKHSFSISLFQFTRQL